MSTGSHTGIEDTAASILHTEKYIARPHGRFGLPAVVKRKFASFQPLPSNHSTLSLVPYFNTKQCDHVDDNPEMNESSSTNLEKHRLHMEYSVKRTIEPCNRKQRRPYIPALRRKTGSVARPKLSISIPTSEDFKKLDDFSEYSNTSIETVTLLDQPPRTSRTVHSGYSPHDGILAVPQATQDEDGERISSKGKIQLSVRDQIAWSVHF